MMRCITSALLLLAVPSVALQAQEGVVGAIAKVLEKASDVNASFGAQRSTGSGAGAGHLQVGSFEFTFELGHAGCLNKRAVRDLGIDKDLCRLAREAAKRRQQMTIRCAAHKADASVPVPSNTDCTQYFPQQGTVLGIVEKRTDGAVVTETSYGPPPDGETGTRPLFYMELGVSVSEIRRLSFQHEGHQLTGRVQEWPTLAFYLNLDRVERLTVYAGVRAGIASLDGFTADSGGSRKASGSGSAFVGGASLGVSLNIGQFSLFAEGEATARRFGNVTWKIPDGSLYSSPLRKDLDLSSRGVNVGLQARWKND